MTDNSIIATQAKEKGVSIDTLVKDLLQSPLANKAEIERLEKMRVEESRISAYSPYSADDWLDERPRMSYNNPYAPVIEIIDGRDLFNFITTDIIHKVREISKSEGGSIGLLLEKWINERLDNYKPTVFDLSMTTDKRFSLNSFNVRLTESMYMRFERKARLLGLGKNQLITYFLTDIIVELTKE